MYNNKIISDERGYSSIITASVLLVETVVCALLFWLFSRADFDWTRGNTLLIQSLIVNTIIFFVCDYTGRVVLHVRNIRRHQILLRSLRNITIFAILDAFVFVAGEFYHPNWQYYLLFVLALFIFSTAFRLVFHVILKHLNYSRGASNVVLVGRGENMLALYQELTDAPVLGYKVCGYFDDAPHDGFGTEEKCPWLGKPSETIGYLKEHGDVWGLFCSLPSARKNEITPIIQYCENNLVHFFSVPNIRNYLYNTVYMNMMGSVPYLSLHNEPLTKLENRFIKRVMDIVISGIFLVTLFPIVLIIVSIVTTITMPGPIFFKQKRNGIDNREFTCLKFRSMKVNSEADTLQATENDPRKTRWGSILRHTSIDELPQFINVFLGDMSVVGPRPHMVKQNEEYSHIIDKYIVRQYVKPGITGWSQVTGFRGETKEVSQMEGRVKGDIYYIEHWSVWLDIYIIIKTIINGICGDKQAY